MTSKFGRHYDARVRNSQLLLLSLTNGEKYICSPNLCETVATPSDAFFSLIISTSLELMHDVEIGTS